MRSRGEIVHQTLIQSCSAECLLVVVSLLERVVCFHLLLFRLPFAAAQLYGLLAREYGAALLLDRFIELVQELLKVFPVRAVHVLVHGVAEALAILLAITEKQVQFGFGLRGFRVEHAEARCRVVTLLLREVLYHFQPEGVFHLAFLRLLVIGRGTDERLHARDRFRVERFFVEVLLQECFHRRLQGDGTVEQSVTAGRIGADRDEVAVSLVT
jgi:hypothetical protein